MDNKFFIYNVAKILSEKTGQKASKTEDFLKELGLLFSEGITNSNFVKIKGIGAFKVVRVKGRESVNVNTGERFLIPPHHKLSFIPENKLKDMINKPFSLFETIEAQEDEAGFLSLAGSRIGEIGETGEAGETGETGEIGEAGERLLLPPIPVPPTPTIEEKPLPPEPPTPTIEEKPLPPEPPTTVIEEKPLPPVPQATRIEEKPLPSVPPAPLIEEKPFPVMPPSPSPPDPSHTHQSSKRKEKKRKKSKSSSTTILLFILYFLLFVLAAGAIYYFFFYNRLDSLDGVFNTRISGKPDITLPGDTIPSENILNIEQAPVDTLALTPSEVSGTDSTTQAVAVQATEPASAPADATPPPRQEPTVQPRTNPTPSTTTSPQTTAASTSNNNNNVLARVRVEPGQRLTLIAERYYGNKVFWVYIYEYNKAKIGRNPNILRTGMEILVPVKGLYGIDANNAASVDKATEIQRTILEGI